MLGVTKHDYRDGLVGCYYDSINTTGSFNSWEDFKEGYLGFYGENMTQFDDTYHFMFRFDVDKQKNDLYQISMYVLLQRKGILTHITVKDIPQDVLDGEVYNWLKGRKDYLNELWREIADN